MSANLTTHQPIRAVGTVSGNQDRIQNYPEGSGQTFLQGTPVSLSSGNVVAWSGTPNYSPGNILGITSYPGRNLASAGKGQSPLYGSIGYPGGAGAVQDVPNQPNAFSIYHGAPFLDGLANVSVASLDTIFEVQVDASSGTTYNATTALVGTQIGLTIDSTGFWYADLAKSTVGTNAVASVVGLNPLDMVSGSITAQVNNGRIWVVFVYNVIQPLV